jgi:hypothetical protein
MSFRALRHPGLPRAVHDVEESHRHHPFFGLGNTGEVGLAFGDGQPLSTEHLWFDTRVDHEPVDVRGVTEGEKSAEVGLPRLSEQ